MIHLDTSFVIDFLREEGRGVEGPAARWLEQRPKESLGVSLFVHCELEAGIAGAVRPDRERERVKQVLSTVTLVAPTPGFALRYGATLSAMRKAGHGIDALDLLIATAALEDDAVLVTANRRHFDVVPGLEVLTYR